MQIYIPIFYAFCTKIRIRFIFTFNTNHGYKAKPVLNSSHRKWSQRKVRNADEFRNRENRKYQGIEEQHYGKKNRTINPPRRREFF